MDTLWCIKITEKRIILYKDKKWSFKLNFVLFVSELKEISTTTVTFEILVD